MDKFGTGKYVSHPPPGLPSPNAIIWLAYECYIWRALGWKFMSCSHVNSCVNLLSWLLIGCSLLWSPSWASLLVDTILFTMTTTHKFPSLEGELRGPVRPNVLLVRINEPGLISIKFSLLNMLSNEHRFYFTVPIFLFFLESSRNKWMNLRLNIRFGIKFAF